MKNTAKKLLFAGAGAIALGATISAPAQAVPESTWDQLAQCESGGNWGINTGNGFFGGIQFTQQTWSAFGGQGSPQGASKADQIKVAEKTLATQGWGAWPACSAKLGLQGSTSHVAEHQESASVKVNTNAQPAQAAPQPAQAAPQPAQAAPQPAQAAPQPAQAAPQPAQAAPQYHQANSAPSVVVKNTGTTKYTVKAGDTVGKIASSYGVDWKKLWHENEGSVHNPNLIYPGQVLTIPSK